MKRVPKDEQETNIIIQRIDERCKIYTSDRRMITKFDKLVTTSDDWKCEYQDEYGKGYSCPYRFVTFRSKRVFRKSENTLQNLAHEDDSEA